jgi:hypothetical protein
VNFAAGLVALAEKYQSSREATIRRFVEVSRQSIAAAFLTWKLKPTQQQLSVALRTAWSQAEAGLGQGAHFG